LIIVITYAVVIHMRFIPKLKVNMHLMWLLSLHFQVC